MFDINKIISDAIAAAVDAHITAIRQEYANKLGEMAERIAALENNPAQGVGTTSAQQPLEETLQSLDNQEWFWHKIRNFTDTAVEQAIEDHTECWDHNDFVTEGRLDDYVTSETLDSEVRDAVRDVMEGATVSIRI